MAINHLKYTL